MDPRQDRGSGPLHRLVDDYLFQQAVQQGGPQAQLIPINVYETEDDVVLVAPMPGVEAADIDIEVVGSAVTLRARLRGPGQSRRRYLLHEWTYGPYERTLSLPIDVDASRANASHDNGVLVVSIPKGLRSRSVRVPLRQVSSSEAVHRGHSGHHSPDRDAGSDTE